MKIPAEIPVWNVATVLGAWSGNTDRMGGYIVGVRCRPATDTTRYRLRVLDKDGYEVYDSKGLKGEVSDHPLRIPVRGMCTVGITEATADEAFDLKFLVEGP